jgi:hypothetical protein
MSHPNPFAACTEGDRAILIDALAMAAERYDEFAATARTEANKATTRGQRTGPAVFTTAGMAQIADQFTRQAAAARRMFDLIAEVAA